MGSDKTIEQDKRGSRISRELLEIMGSNLAGKMLGCRPDEGYPVYYISEKFLTTLNYTYDEFMAESHGLSINMIHPEDRQLADKSIRSALSRGEDYLVEYRIRQHTGGYLWICASGSTSYDEAGESVLVNLCFDITKRKEQEELLSISEEQNRIANRHAGLKVDVYNISTKTLVQTPENAAELGLMPVMSNAPFSVIEKGVIASESVNNYLRFYDAMQQGIPEGRSILCLQKKAGAFFWYHACYSLVFSEDGCPLRGIISYKDITDQWDKELAYQQWSQYLEQQRSSCLGYYEFDLTKDILEHMDEKKPSLLPPQQYQTFSGITRYFAANLVHPKDRCLYLDIFNRNKLLLHYYEGEKNVEIEYRMQQAGEVEYWVLAVIQLLLDPYALSVKAYVLIKDINCEKQEILKLRMLTQVDSLTGLLNRGTTIQKISQILSQNSSGQQHILLMLDIDNFKQINDHFGHLFGDKVLKVIALRLKRILRKDDLLGRLGGDEFLLFLKDISSIGDIHEKLETICDTLCSALEPEAIISGSLGLAFYPQDGETFEELYLKADIALYDAKKHGRNQYAIYDDSMTMKSSIGCEYTNRESAPADSRAGARSL